MYEGSPPIPLLERTTRERLSIWHDRRLARDGVLVAFSERSGGVSTSPYDSLNLAGHVGDDPASVDLNRQRVLDACGVDGLHARLVTAEQVHSDGVEVIALADAGRGAFASGGRPPVASCDAMVTSVPGIPLMMLFADCVPVVLAAPGPAVAVVHAGWRGALAGIAGKTAVALARHAHCGTDQLLVYIGAHIGACHYQTGAEILSQFVDVFGTVARAESGGLDLGRVVAMSLNDAGVDPCNIACLGECTAETTDRFYSYRAEAGLTGRHCALACILPPSS